jgi:tetratricopeptide (TPR) repeat protein
LLKQLQQLLKQLQQEVETEHSEAILYDEANNLLHRIATNWGEDPVVKQWLLGFLKFKKKQMSFVDQAALKVIAQTYKDDPETLNWLKERTRKDNNMSLRTTAVWAIADTWKEQPKTLSWLKAQITESIHDDVQTGAIWAISQHWKKQPEVLAWLQNQVVHSPHGYVRNEALEAIAQSGEMQPETLAWLKKQVAEAAYDDVKVLAVGAMARYWRNDPDTLSWLKDYAHASGDTTVNQAIVRVLAGKGEILEAIALLEPFLQHSSPDQIPSRVWNTLAWFGCVFGYATHTLIQQAGDYSVQFITGKFELHRGSRWGSYQDTRGLCRALNGNFQGAIEDFKIFINFAETHPERQNYKIKSQRRKDWIIALQSGQDPFTLELLEILRDE